LIDHNSVSDLLGSGIRTTGGALTITHVTLADNLGGAAYSQIDTTSSVFNSIAWNNETGFLGSFALFGCNIDQGGNIGTNTDPRFDSPFVGNYHLLSDSPAIDACATGLPIDIDGMIRPFGIAYDMGAYEYKPKGLIYLPVLLK